VSQDREVPTALSTSPFRSELNDAVGLKDYPHSKRYPLIHALHHLNKGLVLTELRRWDAAGWALEDALEGINKNYKLQFACPPLLARATYWRLRGASGKARADLEQVLSISRDCHMSLYQADAQLLLGHVALDDHQQDNASTAFQAAEKLINTHGYELRRYELDLLHVRLLHVTNNTRQAREKLKKTREHFEQIGYKRLHQQAERIENELDS